MTLMIRRLNPDPLHAMQFRPAPPLQVREERESTGVLEVTVTVRWIPLVPAAYGTRVARPARTTTLAPGGDGSHHDRRVRPEQDVVEPAGGAGAGGVGDRDAGGGRDRGGYPGPGAGGNSGGQPVDGAGRGGQARHGVQGGGGDAGGVEGAEHGHTGGGPDLAQRVHQAGGHPGVGRLHRRSAAEARPVEVTPRPIRPG